MKARILWIVPAALCLNACMWLTWIGYQQPRGETDFMPAVSAVPCPRIGVQNLDSNEDRIGITEAVGDVCEIFADGVFAERVRLKDDWLASCARPGGREDSIDGEEVLRIVRLPKSDVSIIAREPIAAVAQIDPAKARIAIPPRWFDYWRSGTLEERAKMINTLGHELTHFAREDGQINFRFQDGGHSKGHCTDERLASYAIGELVAEIWLERHAH